MSRKKTKPQDPWTFSILSKNGWQKFETDKELRIKLLSAIQDYDENIAYIKNPKNQMSPSNISFERNVLLDHIEMIVKSHLESVKK